MDRTPNGTFDSLAGRGSSDLAGAVILDSTTGHKLTITRLTTLDAFNAYADAWDTLLAQAKIENIFLTHSWLSEWWRAFGTGCELWTLVARDSQCLVGIAPFVLASQRGARRLIFMGDTRVSPNHLDVIVAPERREEFVRALVAFLIEQRAAWDILDLDSLPAESPTRDLLLRTLHPHTCFTHTQVTAHCPFISLPATLKEYLDTRGAQTRNEAGRDRRRLERHFAPVKFGRVQTRAEFDVVFDALVRLHQMRWAGRTIKGSFVNPDFIAFHRTVAQHALQRGELRMYYLQVQGAFIAVYYAFRVGARVQGYNASFDLSWAKYSPGILLLNHTLQECIAEDMCEYDFLQGEEEYKRHWATASRDDWCVRAASPTPRGYFAWLRADLPRAARHQAKRFLRR